MFHNATCIYICRVRTPELYGAAACICAPQIVYPETKSCIGQRTERNMHVSKRWQVSIWCGILPTPIVGKHAIQHWLCLLKQLSHGFEEGNPHNAEEAHLQRIGTTCHHPNQPLAVKNTHDKTFSCTLPKHLKQCPAAEPMVLSNVCTEGSGLNNQ